jgi:hypothetical protein
MLLMGLNIGLVAATIFSVLTSHSIPFALAVSCGAIGGVTVYSRIRIGKTGKVRLLYDQVRDNEEAAKKVRTFDALFWATGVLNLVVCLLYVLKGYWIK